MRSSLRLVKIGYTLDEEPRSSRALPILTSLRSLSYLPASPVAAQSQSQFRPHR
jgi:hypothetical protein